MRDIKDEEFTPAVLMSDMPVLVDFYAPWCGPCRSMGMILGDIEKEYAGQLIVVKINVDENPQVMAAYNIKSIPAVLGFKAGELKGSVIASTSKLRLEELIKELLK